MEGVIQDPSEDFKTNFLLLERAVAQFDTRFALRALRSISSLRKKLAETKLAQLNIKKPLKDLLPEAEKALTGEAKKDSIPEIRIYIAILIQVRTLRGGDRAFLTLHRSIYGTRNAIKMVPTSPTTSSMRSAISTDGRSTRSPRVPTSTSPSSTNSSIPSHLQGSRRSLISEASFLLH